VEVEMVEPANSQRWDVEVRGCDIGEDAIESFHGGILP
jgi:hypothetical protein